MSEACTDESCHAVTGWTGSGRDEEPSSATARNVGSTGSSASASGTMVDGAVNTSSNSGTVCADTTTSAPAATNARAPAEWSVWWWVTTTAVTGLPGNVAAT